MSYRGDSPLVWRVISDCAIELRVCVAHWDESQQLVLSEVAVELEAATPRLFHTTGPGLSEETACALLADVAHYVEGRGGPGRTRYQELT